MKVILFLTLSLFSTSVLAFEALKCPLKKDKLNLVSIDIYDGDPKKGYMQGAENESAPFPHRWSLKQDVVPWAVCVYDKQERKRLVQKKIKKGVQICEMKESVVDSGNFNILECEDNRNASKNENI